MGGIVSSLVILDHSCITKVDNIGELSDYFVVPNVDNIEVFQYDANKFIEKIKEYS